ncbi:C-type mannose receptor 2-like isoform X1 [Lytechinus pictus]|uniref:C-type mannose receptor 2-like isoform X1 n=2 Tax=Lytechinus pictus TaxID=7653 RepID=UPI0030B9C896
MFCYFVSKLSFFGVILLEVLASYQIQVVVGLECPNGTGWSEFSSTCYYIQGGSMVWDTAVATCEGHGASIVEITSIEENNYVNSISSGWHIWLNCRDHLVEGQFVCGDDDHPITYTANELSSNTEQADCVYFIAGTWGVYDCAVTPISIVCEIDDTNPQELSSATVETAECPNGTGWSEFSSTCYYVQGGSMVWDTAVATCEGQGASIVEITSVEENNYVNSISSGWHIWLNCRDHLVEGQFVCGDDDHPITYTANEILSSNTEQADCVYFIAGTWGVYDCAATPISIVCEIEVANPQDTSQTVVTTEQPIFSSAESVESTTEEHVPFTAEVTTDQTIPSDTAVITTDMLVYPTAAPKSQMRGLHFGYMKIYSISTGNCLVGHVIYEDLLTSKIRCVARCLSLLDCLSINVFSREGRVQCQLNNSNRTVSSNDFLMVDDCQYFEFIMHF